MNVEFKKTVVRTTFTLSKFDLPFRFLIVLTAERLFQRKFVFEKLFKTSLLSLTSFYLIHSCQFAC